MAISFSHMLDNHQKKLETNALDEFRVHLEASLNRSSKNITDEYESVTESQFENSVDMECYKGMLEDQFFMLDEVRKLANELSITALYKHIELHTKRVIKRYYPSIPDNTFSNVTELQKELPFKLKSLDEYDAVNELRLINNSVKHQGVVSKQLSNAYPTLWTVGEELKNLDSTYDRLYPKIKKYIISLVLTLGTHSATRT